MQERVSWIKTNMTGGTMSALFNISNSYGALQAGSSSSCSGGSSSAEAAGLWRAGAGHSSSSSSGIGAAWVWRTGLGTADEHR